MTTVNFDMYVQYNIKLRFSKFWRESLAIFSMNAGDCMTIVTLATYHHRIVQAMPLILIIIQVYMLCILIGSYAMPPEHIQSDIEWLTLPDYTVLNATNN